MPNSQSPVVSRVIELRQEFGLWQLLRALIVSEQKRRQRQNDLRHLSDRMLKDIGVPQKEFERHRPMVDLLRQRP